MERGCAVPQPQDPPSEATTPPLPLKMLSASPSTVVQPCPTVSTPRPSALSLLFSQIMQPATVLTCFSQNLLSHRSRAGNFLQNLLFQRCPDRSSGAGACLLFQSPETDLGHTPSQGVVEGAWNWYFLKTSQPGSLL